MTDLILGVVDVAYQQEGERAPARITKKGRVHLTDALRIEREMSGHDVNSGPSTTVSVAQVLEEKYHVMQAFFDAHKDDITGALVSSVEGALEDIYAGRMTDDPFSEAGQEVAAEFRQFLLSGEIEEMGIPGVPTRAAQERRSSRFKSGTGPNERPSFIDTSTYELAFRAWAE